MRENPIEQRLPKWRFMWKLDERRRSNWPMARRQVRTCSFGCRQFLDGSAHTSSNRLSVLGSNVAPSFVFRQSPMTRCSMHKARSFGVFKHSLPYHHRIPSDLNLSAFLAWIQSVPLRAQNEVARARQPIIIHRYPLASGPVPPVRFVTACGEQTLRPTRCAAVECERCDKRGGYKWLCDGVYVAGRGPPGVDRNITRQSWLSCRDPDCAGHEGI